MSDAGSARRGSEPTSSTHRVTSLELFFDLVFVFAFTQVTAFMALNPNGAGLVQGLMILAALWWAWGSYTWLTNAFDADAGWTKLAVFAAMGGMLVASLAVPYAFTDDALLFGVAYVLVRVLQPITYIVATRNDPQLRRAIVRLAPGLVGGGVLVLVAGLVDQPYRTWMWVAALLVDYLGTIVLSGGGQDWRIVPGHFAERYSLIIIIALGEEIISIGTGLGTQDLGPLQLSSALLAGVLAVCFWWLYFDITSRMGEVKLASLPPVEQALVARDSYTYLHLPMVAGIVLVALGVKKTLAHPDAPLTAVAVVGLIGGAALYLVALNAFRWRNVRSINWPRTYVALGLLAYGAASWTLETSGVVDLGVVAGLLTVLAAYETHRAGEFRSTLHRNE
ncbi:MAG: low temperature requirement protein A [Actinomycetes bacterium]